MGMTLSPEVQKLIAEKLSTGEYRDEADVIETALREVEQRDALYDAWLKWRLKEGIEQAKRGDGRPYDLERLTADYEAKKNS